MHAWRPEPARLPLSLPEPGLRDAGRREGGAHVIRDEPSPYRMAVEIQSKRKGVLK